MKVLRLALSDKTSAAPTASTRLHHQPARRNLVQRRRHALCSPGKDTAVSHYRGVCGVSRKEAKMQWRKVSARDYPPMPTC